MISYIRRSPQKSRTARSPKCSRRRTDERRAVFELSRTARRTVGRRSVSALAAPRSHSWARGFLLWALPDSRSFLSFFFSFISLYKNHKKKFQ